MTSWDSGAAALRVNGKIAACTIGEPGNKKDTLIVHIEKALTEVQGAYTVINQQFALHEGAGLPVSEPGGGSGRRWSQAGKNVLQTGIFN